MGVEVVIDFDRGEDEPRRQAQAFVSHFARQGITISGGALYVRESDAVDAVEAAIREERRAMLNEQ